MSERESDPEVVITIEEKVVEEPAPTALACASTEPPADETIPKAGQVPAVSEFERVSIEFICRQRDEALVRVTELESVLAGYDDVVSEHTRMRELLSRLAQLVGCGEFESLEQVVVRKLAMLDALTQQEVREGLREAARISQLSETNTRIKQLEEEVNRLRARR